MPETNERAKRAPMTETSALIALAHHTLSQVYKKPVSVVLGPADTMPAPGLCLYLSMTGNVFEDTERETYVGPAEELARDLVTTFTQKFGADPASMKAFFQLVAELGFAALVPPGGLYDAADVEATEALRGKPIASAEVLRAAMGQPVRPIVLPPPEPGVVVKIGPGGHEEGSLVLGPVALDSIRAEVAEAAPELAPEAGAFGYRAMRRLISGLLSALHEAKAPVASFAGVPFPRGGAPALGRPGQITVEADSGAHVLTENQWLGLWQHVHRVRLGGLPRAPEKGQPPGHNCTTDELVHSVGDLATYARMAVESEGLNARELEAQLIEARAELSGAREIIRRAGLLEATDVGAAADVMHLQACAADIRREAAPYLPEGGQLGFGVGMLLRDYARARAALARFWPELQAREPFYPLADVVTNLLYRAGVSPMVGAVELSPEADWALLGASLGLGFVMARVTLVAAAGTLVGSGSCTDQDADTALLRASAAAAAELDLAAAKCTGGARGAAEAMLGRANGREVDRAQAAREGDETRPTARA